MPNSIHLIVAFILIGMELPLAGMADTQGPATKPEPPAIESIAKSDRLGFVLAMLDERDRALTNCRFHFAEFVVNTNRKTGARQDRGKQYDFEYRRDGGVEWMRVVHHAPLGNPPARILSISEGNWDGHVSRGTSSPPYSGDHAGGRVDEEMGGALRTWYFEMFGSHVGVMGVGWPSMTAMIRQAAAEGKSIEITSGRLEDVPVVRVSFTISIDTMTFWLDPSRGYCPVGVDRDDATGTTRHRVLELKLVSGVWFASRTKRIDDLPGLDQIGQVVYEADRFEVGTVTPEQVRIVFPPDCRVIDAVQRVAYTILPDGRYQLTRLADTEQQVIHDPPKSDIVASVAGAAKLYTTEELIPAGQAERKNTGVRASIIAVNVVVIGAALGAWIWKRRRRAVA